MKRAPKTGVDLGLYLSAIPLLARNPSIIVVPLLMAVVGYLLNLVLLPFSGGVAGSLTLNLAGLIQFMLTMFGLGAACTVADDAWRHGRASFDRAWDETRRRSSDILMAAVGFGLILTVGVYVTQIFGLIGYVLEIAIAVFLIWTIPAAAIGGIPGGAAIQVSIDRVRSSPPAAIIVAVVSFALIAFAVPYAASWLDMLASTWVSGSALVAVVGLIQALLQAIAVGYIALVLTKTYTDNAFGRR